MTVRVTDPPPGKECQVDFGRLGLVPDGERRRVCHGLDLHGLLQPPPVRLADVPPDDRRGDQRLRGRLGLLRRDLPRRHPRQHEVHRHHGREHRAADQRHLHGVRPVEGLLHRRRPGGDPHRQATGRTRGALRAAQLLRRRGVRRPARLPGRGRDLVQHHGRACASTAPPSAGPSKRSGPRSCRCCCPCPGRRSTRRRGPIPRSTATSTSKSTRRSTRSTTTWSAGRCGPGVTRPRSSCT